MTIRIFVGCAAEDLESQLVLAYSLKKYASEPVDIEWMRLSKDPYSPFYSDGSAGWQTRLWSTPFSGFRWIVPSLCSFQGRAIYCDSDFIFRADIAELWNQPMGGKVCLAKGGIDSWRFCMTLWDCEEARDVLPNPRQLWAKEAHRETQHRFKGASFVGRFEGGWNVVDGEDFKRLDDPRIKAIHYSSEAHQPHLKYAIPRLEAEGKKHWFDGVVAPHWRKDVQQLFDDEFAQATKEGWSIEEFRSEEDFGSYDKQSHAGGYRSNRWAKRV